VEQVMHGADYDSCNTCQPDYSFNLIVVPFYKKH